MDSLQSHCSFNVASMFEVRGYIGVVKTVYAEKQLFSGVENYFTNAMLYRDEQEDEANDGNKAM